jgi:hypothetical protein
MTELEQTEELTPLEQLEAISGKDRARVILATVHGLIRDEQRLTAAAVDAQCFMLPHWTECGDDELAQAQAVIDAEANAHVAQLEAEAANVVEDIMGDTMKATTPIPPEQPPTIDKDTALASLNESIRLREAARTALNVAVRKRQELRGKLADLLQEWSTGLPKISHRDALMEVVRTQQLTKAERQEATRPGPSAWDRQAYYSTGRGSAPAFVQSRMRNGGNRRGSLPLSRLRGKLDLGGTAPIRRTDTRGAAKLPSER